MFVITKIDVEKVTKFPLFFGFNRQRIKMRLLCFSTLIYITGMLIIHRRAQYTVVYQPHNYGNTHTEFMHCVSSLPLFLTRNVSSQED